MLELRDAFGDLAEGVDQHGHAVVGRADHPAAGFQGTHLCHLQVLQRTDGGAEPGVVADRQQDVALRGQIGGELGIDHFVADIRGDPVSLGHQRALIGVATGEVGHRQVEEGDQPAQNLLQRDVFAEGHQLLLEVGALTLADHGNAVVIALLAAFIVLADRHARDQRGLPIISETAHHAEVAVDEFLEHRYRGFRPDDQIGLLRAEGHVAIKRELGVQLLRVPLQVLLDVALHGRDLQRRASRLGPCVALERRTDCPGGDQQDDTRRQECRTAAQASQVHQQGCGQRQGKGHEPDTADRRQARQRAVQLAVAGVEPWEAGEEPATKGFLDQPQRGEGQGIGQGRLTAAQPARPDRRGQGEEQRHASTEADGEERGQWHGGRAVVVDADVNPAGAGEEQAETIPPATPERGLGRQVAQAQVEEGERQQFQGPEIEGGERQGRKGASGERQQVARPAGAGDPVHARSLGGWGAGEVRGEPFVAGSGRDYPRAPLRCGGACANQWDSGERRNR